MLRPIQYALLMDFDRSRLDLAFLVSRWPSHSHTFVTAWGEFCPSLEDVAIIIGLPILAPITRWMPSTQKRRNWSRICMMRCQGPSIPQTKGHIFLGLSISKMELDRIAHANWPHSLLIGCHFLSSPVHLMLGSICSCFLWRPC